MIEPLDIEIEATLDTLRAAGFEVAASILEREARCRLMAEADLSRALEYTAHAHAQFARIEALARYLERAITNGEHQKGSPP